jgi:hypothetical protein
MAELPERTLTGLSPCDAIQLNTPPRTVLRVMLPTNWQPADLLVEEFLGDRWGPLKTMDGVPIKLVGLAGDIVRADECVFQHARSVRFKSSATQSGPRTIKVQIARISELINGTGA